MHEMTSCERIKRAVSRKEADRIPALDIAWKATIQRWRQEGLPSDVDFREYLGMDIEQRLAVDNSPRYEKRVIEETEDYLIRTTQWGATEKNFKTSASTPEFLSFHITSREAWEEAKARIAPTSDRIDWPLLKKNYKTWREKGHYIHARLFFGFDVTHSWMMGTEQMLMYMRMDPELCMDIFHHTLETAIALYEQIWEAGYTFDAVGWPDDMGYKFHQFFDVATYREMVMPYHKRAAEWARSKGCQVHMHSDGDINPFLDDLAAIGIECLNPIEVKAGMDPLAVKAKYGHQMALHGGVNSLLYANTDAFIAEMDRLVPTLMKGGGYIFGSDHSIPSNVSLEDMRKILEYAKQIGTF